MTNQKNTTQIKLPIYPAVVSICMLLAPLPWPYMFYIILKWVVGGTAAYYFYANAAYKSLGFLSGKWMIPLILIFVLYNPLAPIYSFSKGVWIFLNVATVATIWLYVISMRRIKIIPNREIEDEEDKKFWG